MSLPTYTEAGWTGTFTREQYPGALANGTKARKAGSLPGDAHQDGALCTVLGSIGHKDMPGPIYFVEWSDMPRVACAITWDRLEVGS